MAELISISRKCRVTRAGPELAESIYALIADCGRELAASGFENWTLPRVSVEALREPDALAWYMSRLAVRPEWQQRGIGLELLTVAENYARKHGVAALRLDALAANERLTS